MKTTIMRIALAAVAAIVSMTMNAQDALVATLQHGDNMQAFYGGNALKQALEAAQTGDVISLSAGTFNASEITKAVTIQGAGYVQDVKNNRYCTTIKGSPNSYVKVELPKDEKGLTFEGIYFADEIKVYNDIESLMFRKCLLYSIDMLNNQCWAKNCFFEQCRIKKLILGKSQSLLFQNCIIKETLGKTEEASVLFNHCVYLATSNTILVATFKNSLINGNIGAYNYGISGNSAFYNNVLYPAHRSIKEGGENILISETDFKALFADGEFAYTDERTYELTAAAAQQYLGDDGTQVGIYGGDTPFTDVPSNPQITARQIATKTNDDGKLSVKITVEAQK